MNYKIILNNKSYGPYDLEKLQSFADRGKLKSDMVLMDEIGNKYYAKDIIASLNTVDLTYLSDSANSSNNDYVDLTDDNSRNNQITFRNYSQNDSNDYVDLTGDTEDNSDKYTMIGNDGRQYGPYSLEELQRFVSENRIAPNTVLINHRGQRLEAKFLLNFPNYSNNSFNNSYNNSYSGTNNSGMGSGSTLPYELNGLNWGAFFLPFFWGLSHNTWLVLACLIPSVGWIVSFILLFKGNEWAWQNRKWSSPMQFLEVQRIWYKWGVGVIIASFVLGLFPLLFLGCC